MADKKTIYHTFKRRKLDGELWFTKARVLQTKSPVVIKLTPGHIRDAIERNGQADAQNCAGAVCVTKHKNLFDHPVTGMVDWHRSRVYICEPPKKNGHYYCRIYAHNDDVEELFDTDAGLKKLLRRVEGKGHIDITLYPVKKRGVNPLTGRPVRSGTRGPGYSGPSGKEHQPRRTGDELRWFNYTSAKAGGIVPAPDEKLL